MIKVTQVRTASQMRRFVQFPLVLYKNCPHYVPAIYADERNVLNPAKNPNLVDCEVRCYLAYKDGKAAGRIAAIEQKAYNALSGRKCLRFSRFDCIDDREVAAALFAAVEAFGREKGLDTLHGPWGFDDMDREGMLTEGFDRRATYATNYNFEYYKNLVTSLGFQDESEWVEYEFDMPEEVDARIAHVASYIQKKMGVCEQAESMPMKRLIAKYGHDALEMVNLAYADLDCYVPVHGKIIDQVLRQFATVINPRYFSLLTDKEGEVAAMAVMLPSICAPLQKSGGRMTLPTVLRLVKAISNPKELEMVLIAVHPKYQKMGLNSVMMSRIIANVIEDKIERVESNPELVSNTAVQEQWNSMGRRIIKRRKTFSKKIGE